MMIMMMMMMMMTENCVRKVSEERENVCSLYLNIGIWLDLFLEGRRNPL